MCVLALGLGACGGSGDGFEKLIASADKGLEEKKSVIEQAREDRRVSVAAGVERLFTALGSRGIAQSHESSHRFSPLPTKERIGNLGGRAFAPPPARTGPVNRIGSRPSATEGLLTTGTGSGAMPAWLDGAYSSGFGTR